MDPSAASPTPFRLRLLGGARIDGPEGPVGGRAGQRNSLALLALLADAPEQSRPRETLAALLWPERSSRAARQLLNTTVYQLRDALDPDALVNRNGDLQLDDDLVTSDVAELTAAVEAGRWQHVLDLYDGPFLEGFSGPPSVEFEAWTAERRERYESLYHRALEALAEAAETSGDQEAAIERWERLVRRRPDRASAVERLMRALEAVGRRGRALEVARRHAAHMRREFDARPDPGVEALAERLRREPSSRTAPGDTVAVEESDDAAGPSRDSTRRLPTAGPATSLGIGLAAFVLLVVGVAWLDPLGTDPAGDAAPAGERLSATESPAARAAFERGERLFDTGRFDAAADAFREAVVEDTTFAFAYYRLSQARLWADRPMTLPFDADERALHYRVRLPRRDRLLIEAYAAWRGGDAVEAEFRYGRFVADHPDDPEGWFMLGETLFHYNPPRGRSIEESRNAFERTVALDSTHWGARWHLALLDTESGRREEARRRLEALLEDGPSRATALEIRALLASIAEDPAALAALEADLREADEIQLFGVLSRAAVLADDLEGARAVARLLTDESRDAWPRILGYQSLAALDLAEGRLREAEQRFAAIDPLDPERRWAGMDLEVRRALFPFLPDPTGRIRSTREALVRARPELETPSAVAANGADDRAGTYLVGLLEAATGDPLASDRARALEEVGALGLAAAVRAEAKRRSRRPIEALAQLELSRRPVWFGWALSSPIYGQVYERFARAEVLRDLGRGEEALRWYASFEAHSLFDLIYLAPSHLRRAEIHASLGNAEEAARHRARFVELWADADPELRPVVEAARRALVRLSAPGPGPRRVRR